MWGLQLEQDSWPLFPLLPHCSRSLSSPAPVTFISNQQLEPQVSQCVFSIIFTMVLCTNSRWPNLMGRVVPRFSFFIAAVDVDTTSVSVEGRICHWLTCILTFYLSSQIFDAVWETTVTEVILIYRKFFSLDYWKCTTIADIISNYWADVIMLLRGT